ncbi:MAG: hypothetical protein U5L08_07510 [Xanthomonadales bacterium]|nr:hypothetical protein [Xanthomonadales bacterium]
MLRHAREAIEQLLPAVVPGQLEGRTDEAWYWVAPILLDLEDDEENAWACWAREDLAHEWTHDEREAYAEGWTEHLEHAWRIVQGQRPSGRPPEDLVELLARVAIAGPATSALRSLRSVSGHCAADTPVWLRDGAARIGWSYRRLFNQIETSVLIRGGYRSKTSKPYWRQILRYALEGGLTAVNDEYFHMLAESTAASSQAPEVRVHSHRRGLRGRRGAARQPRGVGRDRFREWRSGTAPQASADALRRALRQGGRG